MLETITHNGIDWNVEVQPFDNGTWQGGKFLTEVTPELVEDTPELLDQWTRAITGHVLSHRPAKYGWRFRPKLMKENDFETVTTRYWLRCRVFWSREQAEVAEEMVVLPVVPIAPIQTIGGLS